MNAQSSNVYNGRHASVDHHHSSGVSLRQLVSALIDIRRHWYQTLPQYTPLLEQPTCQTAVCILSPQACDVSSSNRY